MSNRTATSFNALQLELKKEQASTLGRAGEKVQAALQQLRAAPADDHDQITRLRYAAAEAVHRYLIQREAMGLRGHDAAIEEYGIPHHVLNLVGARRP